MARLQREDAKQTLQSVTPGQIRISMPKKILVFLLIAFIGAVGTTTVSVLGSLGYIDSGYEMLDDIIPEEPLEYVNVIYNSVEGGLVEGEFDQRIVRGEDTSEVLAVADDGYEFLQWSDGVKDPARIDYNVQGDMEIYALFQYVGEPQEDPNGDPTEDEDSQRPQQQEQENNSDTEESPDAPPMSSPTKYDAYNQVINGQTYFKDVLDQYKDAAREDMQNSGEADKEGNSIADAYYNILN